MPADQLFVSPATRAATDLVVRELVAASGRRLETFIATAHQWSPEWRAAVQQLQWHIELTPGQLKELNREILDLVGRYKALTPEPGARRVVVEQSAYPLGDPE